MYKIFPIDGTKKGAKKSWGLQNRMRLRGVGRVAALKFEDLELGELEETTQVVLPSPVTLTREWGHCYCGFSVDIQ